MSRLDETSDVVCLFTEHSLGRPWILFEAGVAKGKPKNIPVLGIALGVELQRVQTGPFNLFQNMESGIDDLKSLVSQLAKRVPGLELDDQVVETQVRAFQGTIKAALKSVPASKPDLAQGDNREGTSNAKLLEAIKLIPARVAERIGSKPARGFGATQMPLAALMEEAYKRAKDALQIGATAFQIRLMLLDIGLSKTQATAVIDSASRDINAERSKSFARTESAEAEGGSENDSDL